MSDLWNMWTERIQELENSRMYCTNNNDNNNEKDGVEGSTYAVLARVKTTHFLREKKAQRRKVGTNRNTMEWTKWKTN